MTPIEKAQQEARESIIETFEDGTVRYCPRDLETKIATTHANAVKECEARISKESLSEIEIQNVVIETIGRQYQERFNEHIDYDQWRGIREEMRTCGTMIFKKIRDDLELNREALTTQDDKGDNK